MCVSVCMWHLLTSLDFDAKSISPFVFFPSTSCNIVSCHVPKRAAGHRNVRSAFTHLQLLSDQTLLLRRSPGRTRLFVASSQGDTGSRSRETYRHLLAAVHRLLLKIAMPAAWDHRRRRASSSPSGLWERKQEMDLSVVLDRTIGD